MWVQVLALNRTRLPAEALFLIRHQRFNALHRPGQPYDELLCDADRNMVCLQESPPNTPTFPLCSDHPACSSAGGKPAPVPLAPF